MRRLARGPAPSPSSLPRVAPRPVLRSDSRLRPILHSLLPGPFPFRSRPGGLSCPFPFFKGVTVVVLVFCKSSVSLESALHLLPNPTLTLTFQRRVRPHLPPQGSFSAPPPLLRMPWALSAAPGRGGGSPAAASARRAPAEVTSLRRWHSAQPLALSFPRPFCRKAAWTAVLASGFGLCASFSSPFMLIFLRTPRL